MQPDKAIICDPSTGERVALVQSTAPGKLAGYVADAKNAQRDWASVTPEVRAKHLRRIGDELLRRQDHIADIECRNIGKLLTDAYEDVRTAAEMFYYYAGACMQPSGNTYPTGEGGVLHSHREPIGVVAGIGAWNFPIVIAASKVAPALAAGNAILFKPAPISPLSALELGQLGKSAGLPDGLLQIVTGGASLGEAIASQRDIGMVSFTGSAAVGRRLIELSAADLKCLVLELGGKSANIIFADADRTEVARHAVLSGMANAGQDCCARSRILIERSVYDEVLGAVTDELSKLVLGDPRDPVTTMGPLSSEQHRDRVASMVRAATNSGARVVTGGSELQRVGCFYQPTLLDRVPLGSEIAQQEVFGPVLVALPFADESEAIAIANATRYGLSGSVWTADSRRAQRVARGLHTGVVSINASTSVHISAPFGGVKASGLGRQSGMTALESYSELKTVFQGISQTP